MLGVLVRPGRPSATHFRRLAAIETRQSRLGTTGGRGASRPIRTTSAPARRAFSIPDLVSVVTVRARPEPGHTRPGSLRRQGLGPDRAVDADAAEDSGAAAGIGDQALEQRLDRAQR
jgi:hypothetical protein